MGLGEGVAFPAIHSLLARHVPVDHRSKSVGRPLFCVLCRICISPRQCTVMNENWDDRTRTLCGPLGYLLIWVYFFPTNCGKRWLLRALKVDVADLVRGRVQPHRMNYLLRVRPEVATLLLDKRVALFSL